MSKEPLESVEPADKVTAPVLRPKSLPLAPPEHENPEFVPARMINEVLYCERLMYLEWVQSEWADNRFTVDGKAVHRNVDKRAQQLKVPANDDAKVEGKEQLPYTARSIWLSSERVGITTKIDVVDVDGDRVVPIEYKRGKQPPNGPYLPERAQVAAQALVLREHGYRCDGGEIYFAGDRQRVEVPLTADLEATVLHAVARAKRVASSGECPPPLEDSPKCHGCSLSGICLPDETRQLKKDDDARLRALFDLSENDPWGLSEGPPEVAERTVRRLFPARDDKIPLYIQGQGSSLRLNGDRLAVATEDEPTTYVRLGNTSSVTVYGNVQITAQALHRLMEEGIPVLFATRGGWFLGRALGADTKNVELRAAQYRAVNDPARALNVARALVHTKIGNCRTLLRRNHREPPAVALFELKQLARKALEAESIESLLGIEGTAARVYFREFTGMLKINIDTFDFEGRNRRPPRDPINALLSFCYGLLVRETTMAAHAVGLDPLLGFYHQPRFGRASLALDLMEEFRPILADSTVISVINNGVVDASDFVRGHGSVALKPPARKRVVQAMERRIDQLVTHPIFDYRLSYRRVLEIQARLLSRLLMGEIETYPGFRVR